MRRIHHCGHWAHLKWVNWRNMLEIQTCHRSWLEATVRVLTGNVLASLLPNLTMRQCWSLIESQIDKLFGVLASELGNTTALASKTIIFHIYLREEVSIHSPLYGNKFVRLLLLGLGSCCDFPTEFALEWVFNNLLPVNDVDFPQVLSESDELALRSIPLRGKYILLMIWEVRLVLGSLLIGQDFPALDAQHIPIALSLWKVQVLEELAPLFSSLL